MRYLLLFLFLIINVFLYVLNFELFNSIVNMDFGFDVFATMPILIMLFIGLLFILLFILIGNNDDKKYKMIMTQLESKISLLEKDLEIKDLKQQVNRNIEVLENPTIIEPENN